MFTQTMIELDKVVSPAGLNRGGLTDVLEAQSRLTNLERDDLYENRINPIKLSRSRCSRVWTKNTSR